MYLIMDSMTQSNHTKGAKINVKLGFGLIREVTATKSENDTQHAPLKTTNQNLTYFAIRL